MSNKVDLVNEFSEKGYQVALLTSFSTDLVFFEKMLLRQFEENGCRYIGIYADANCIQEALRHREAIMHLGRSYSMQSVWTTGAFHPKVYLFLGDKKAKVLIGSGNLTAPGFIKNHEVFGVFSYSAENLEDLSLIRASYEMFQTLHRQNPSESMNRLFDKAGSYSYLHTNAPGQSDNGITLVHNLDVSIDEQLRKILPTQIQGIEVFTPYFDTSLAVLYRWQAELQPKAVSVALQYGTTNYPIGFRIASNVRLMELNFTQNSHQRYHGKVFRFIGNEEEVIVYGSANCSRQALMESFSDRGNAEAVVVERGALGAFSGFFIDELTVHPLDPETFSVSEAADETQPATKSFRFVSAIAYHDRFVMQLVCDDVPSRILIDGKDGQVTSDDSHVTATWSGAVFQEMPSIFDFRIVFAINEFAAMGWFVHEQALVNFQTNALVHPLLRLKDDPYLVDYENVVLLLTDMLNRLALTTEDLDDRIGFKTGSLALHERSEVNGVVEVSDDVEDYYVTDEWVAQSYGRLGKIDIIGELVAQLLQPFRLHQDSPAHEASATTSMPETVVSSPVITENLHHKIDKQMKTFIRRYRQGVTSQTYLEKVPSSVLVRNARVYSAFLWRIHNMELSMLPPIIETNDLLDELYVVFSSLCEYGLKNMVQVDEVQDLVPQMFSVLMGLDFKADGFDDLDEARCERAAISQFLQNVHDNIAPIRTTYEEFLLAAVPFIRALGRNESYAELCSRIEHRFSFILFNQLVDRLELIEGVTLRHKPTLERPLVVVHTNVTLNVPFAHLQLNVFKQVLAVHEWHNAPKYVVSFRNLNPEANLEKYLLIFDKAKNRLSKKYVYRNTLPRVERKKHVHRSDLLDAIERGDIDFLSNDFR